MLSYCLDSDKRGPVDSLGSRQLLATAVRVSTRKLVLNARGWKQQLHRREELQDDFASSSLTM